MGKRRTGGRLQQFATEAFLHWQRQALHTLPHVGVAGGDLAAVGSGVRRDNPVNGIERKQEVKRKTPALRTALSGTMKH